jgi:hypothetical protein
MRPGRRAFVVLASVTAAVVAMLAWQRQVAAGLRGEIARQRDLAREKAALETERRRLMAGQPTAEEVADLIAKRLVAEQLRSRLATMRRREEEAARLAVASSAAEVAEPVTSMVGTTLAAQRWQNAGQATADAAFQTTLWAAAVGDVDALANLLAFDADARQQATATFDRLPTAVQNEVGTPERLIALLTAVDIPLGSAAILGQFPTPTGTRISAQLADVGGKLKAAMFTMQADGDRWRLQVPAAVVGKYSDWLHAVPQAAGQR